MEDLKKLLDNPDTSIALVGATDNAAKFGNVIFHDLQRKGFVVFPVNPNRKTVGGKQAYAGLADLPKEPSIVNFVVPPEVTLKVLQACLELNCMNVWLQPGAESPKVLSYLQENNFNYLANTCIMVESRFRVGH